MTIELDELLERNKSVVIIVEAPTGVRYSNRCSGVQIQTKSAEGFVLPLPKFDPTAFPVFTNTWWYVTHPGGSIIMAENKRIILDSLNSALNSDRMHTIPIKNIKVTEKDSYEAWVHIEFDLEYIDEKGKGPRYASKRFNGILTWANSD